MWALECEGDLFGGKQLWLRPGKKFLFGRTSGGEELQYILSDKTVSKQHLMVTIDEVKESDYTDSRARSCITLKDMNTKIGTIINGEKIRGESRVLDRVDNEVRLGRYPHLFRFAWIPVCLSFMFTKSELKSDPYTSLFENFGPLDIKILLDYDRESTTHYVAKKRNTSKGLRALIDGKYIVYNDTFIPALIKATTPNENGIVPIEDDFKNFPDPLHFLPPRGAELTDRDATAYSPDDRRRDMFDGYTFIFYDETQYENLSTTIFAGKGKALHQRVVPEETSVLDFVRYVKNVAGEKGLGEFEDGSEGKGVVVVKYEPQKGVHIAWHNQFAVDVALSLDQRLVGQGEFLDVILGCDPSVLRRALEESPPSTMASHAPPAAQPVQPSQATPPEAPAESISQPARKGRGRRAAVPVFKGFEDDEWATPAVKLNSIPESNSMDIDHAPAPESQSLFVSQQEPSIDVDRDVSEPPVAQPRMSRKRAAPLIDDQELINTLAPNAARLKKRRLEEAAERRSRGESTQPSRPAPEPVKEKTPEPEPEPKAKPKRRTRKEMDSAAALIDARNAEDADEAELHEPDVIDYSSIDVDAVRNAIEVFEIAVTRKPSTRRAAQADESDRWNDKWNGRKDFKKFRRQGAAPKRDHGRVIVPLEEAKKKDYGLGDEYWGEDPITNESQRASKKTRKDKAVVEEVQQNDSSDSDALESNHRRRPRPKLISGNQSEDDAIVIPSSDVEIEQDPRLTFARKDTTTQGTTQSSSLNDKTAATRNIPAKGTKRSAEKEAAKPPPKRVKQTTLDVGGRARGRRTVEDSEDSDDMGFGFRRRR